MMKKNQEAARKKAEDAKAKSKALAEKSKAAAAKAAEAKKAAAVKAEAKRKEMAKKTAALNKTVGGTSRFAKSMSKGPVKMKDPLEGKKFNPFSVFGKKN
jgi:septal ring factor EnvC (AmiA/AmiB activator)